MCKDLVVWPKAKMTAWSSDGQLSHHPLAIMEWKVVHRFNVRRAENIRKEHVSDVAWLQEKSKRNEISVGYAVLVECVPGQNTVLRCTKVSGDDTDHRWLVLLAK